MAEERFEESKTRSAVRRMLENSSAEERENLRLWSKAIIEIYKSDASAFQKSKKAMTVTYSSKTILPLLRALGSYARRHAWDGRGPAMKLGLGGAAAGVLFFGFQGAGIAAFGTAVGVPLFFLTGAVFAVAGVVWQEIAGKDGTGK
ncbi:hypothetical protein FHT36_000311 [Xanthobacter sp. SG618]|uniref:hypothetical protein n=1 Tax=Xanthobacter sp. SG618 TaxID=2587121 RepID=UPI00145EB06A|nr:hypothetical protein [Xanthobacter sp. SG618]NMN56433.1 hypothetical protein [Xanthobacter sp. SG618]